MRETRVLSKRAFHLGSLGGKFEWLSKIRGFVNKIISIRGQQIGLFHYEFDSNTRGRVVPESTCFEARVVVSFFD